MTILSDVKTQLSLEPDYDAFDDELLILIQTFGSELTQLGIGPTSGVLIDVTTEWSAYTNNDFLKNNIKTLMALKVKMVFDPPTTSYLIESMNKIISELTWRISVNREGEEWTDPMLP